MNEDFPSHQQSAERNSTRSCSTLSTDEPAQLSRRSNNHALVGSSHSDSHGISDLFWREWAGGTGGDRGSTPPAKCQPLAILVSSIGKATLKQPPTDASSPLSLSATRFTRQTHDVRLVDQTRLIVEPPNLKLEEEPILTSRSHLTTEAKERVKASVIRERMQRMLCTSGQSDSDSRE